MQSSPLWGLLFFVLTAVFSISCTAEALPPTPTIAPPPTSLPISNEAGEIISEQGEAAWVLISGVDEHGLIVEHDMPLLLEPRADSLMGQWLVHTGTPAAVREIRHSGPQNLQRFYRIETLDGASGWISDYYVRRQAYVFIDAAESVSLHIEPNGDVSAELPNVSPVRLIDPTNSDWWQVESMDGSVTGWVEVINIKESADRQFLYNEQHEHPNIVTDEP